VAPALGLNQLRRVPALDGIDEIVRSCAERGKSLLFSFQYGIKDPQIASTVDIVKNTAKTCGDLNIPLWLNANTAETFLLMEDFARQGYSESAHPEAFSEDMTQFALSTLAAHYLNIGILERELPGGNIIWGVFGQSNTTSVINSGLNVGAIQMAAIKYSDSMSLVLPFVDYVALGEEMVAAGAYLSEDPVNTSTLIGSDFIKIMLIGLMIVLIVKNLAGV
jgi:hypothetical protein